jgi:hypothetical protein
MRQRPMPISSHIGSRSWATPVPAATPVQVEDAVALRADSQVAPPNATWRTR